MMPSLKKQSISGVKWSGFSMGTTTTLHFVTLAVLARLLSPSDFGLMGMFMVVVGFAQYFADMGLSNAIIQRQNVPESHLSSFFWMNILAGIVLFIGIISIRPVAVSYFKEPSLSKYLTFAAPLFLITPVGQIFRTLLRKELNFKILSRIEITGAAVYSISAIGLALLKFGVLSLILGQIIRTLGTVIILLFVFRKIWLPRFHLNINDIKSYLSFGTFQMGERMMNYIHSNIDYVIIGRFLGPEALGYYTLAYQIMVFPQTRINPIIIKVAFPAFSKIQNDNPMLRRGYCKVINYITLLSFPMLAGMFVIAPEFIKVVYGAKWAPSIIILQIFCLVGAFKSLANPVGSVLLAKGRADIGFYWNFGAVIFVSIAVIVGKTWGIVGVAVGILILQPFRTLIIQSIVNKLIDLKSSQYFKAIESPLVCSVFMIIVIMILKMILVKLNMLTLLIIIVVVGSMIYIISYYIKDKIALIELKSMLKRN